MKKALEHLKKKKKRKHHHKYKVEYSRSVSSSSLSSEDHKRSKHNKPKKNKNQQTEPSDMDFVHEGSHYYPAQPPANAQRPPYQPAPQTGGYYPTYPAPQPQQYERPQTPNQPPANYAKPPAPAYVPPQTTQPPAKVQPAIPQPSPTPPRVPPSQPPRTDKPTENPLGMLGMHVETVTTTHKLAIKPKITKSLQTLHPKLVHLGDILADKNMTSDLKVTALKSVELMFPTKRFYRVTLSDEGKREEFPIINQKLKYLEPESLKLYVYEGDKDTPSAVIGGIFWAEENSMKLLDPKTFLLDLLITNNPDDFKEISKTLKSNMKAEKPEYVMH